MVLGYFTGCFSTHTKDSSSRKLSPSLGDFLWACFQRYKCSNSSIFNFNFSHNWLIRVQICFLSKWRKALFRPTDLILASFRLAGMLWEKRKKSSPFIYLNGPRWSTQSGWQRTKRTAYQKSWIRVKLHNINGQSWKVHVRQQKSIFQLFMVAFVEKETLFLHYPPTERNSGAVTEEWT